MATITGAGGMIKIGSTKLADITNWTLNTSSNNPPYASSATSGGKTRNAGVKDFSGSMSFKLDLSDPLTDDFDEGSKVTLLLYIDATRFYTAPSIIDTMSLSVDINDGDTIGGDAAFSRTGALIKPTYA